MWLLGNNLPNMIFKSELHGRKSQARVGKHGISFHQLCVKA